MGPFLLVGDVGATKAVLAVASLDAGMLKTAGETTFATRGHGTLQNVAREFLREVDLPISAACFSVAGPVVDGEVWFPNLDWRVSQEELREALGLPCVLLINDLQATALAVPHLSPTQVVTLQDGVPDPGGVRAVVAAGTGLGEAILIPDGAGYRAFPSEGGHTDFAPNGELQEELLVFLRQRYGHVGYERVCSGQGVANIYRFLRSRGGAPEPEWLTRMLAAAEDPTPIIVASGITETPRCSICRQTLELFASILGAETGNLALRTLSSGGVYVGGGMPLRTLPVLRSGGFLAAVRHKGPMSELVRRMPVHVILEPRTAMLGAARHVLGPEMEAPAVAGAGARASLP